MANAAYKYLLDTNAVSDLVRNPQGVVAKRIAKVGEAVVCTSIIVACELRYGAAKKGSERLSEQVELVLSVLPILALEQEVDRVYGEIRVALETSGTPIGGNDLLIAAQARSAALTIVTSNVKEFQRVPKLKVVYWLAL